MSFKDKVLENYDKNKAVDLLKMMIETPSVTGDETELAKKISEFMLQNGYSPRAIESNLVTFSFLSQTRIRLLDAAGEIVADSGSPPSSGVYRVSIPAAAGGVSVGADPVVRGGYFIAGEPLDVPLPPGPGSQYISILRKRTIFQ